LRDEPRSEIVVKIPAGSPGEARQYVIDYHEGIAEYLRKQGWDAQLRLRKEGDDEVLIVGLGADDSDVDSEPL
jgi:hypothetical protein